MLRGCRRKFTGFFRSACPLFPVLLSFRFPARLSFFCSFVLLSSVPLLFFLFFCPFVFLSLFTCFCPFVLLSSVLLSFCLPFPPALYNIIRWSSCRRAFCVLDSCQERRKVHDFCKIICRKVCRFRGKLYLCTRFRPEPGCEQQGKSSLKGLHETVE